LPTSTINRHGQRHSRGRTFVAEKFGPHDLAVRGEGFTYDKTHRRYAELLEV